MVLKRQAGEKIHIDYTDGISIYDAKTGKELKTQLFVGTLAFSSYFYAEFCWDQKQASFLKVQENMWRFLGGVTPYLVVDNLKSGVSKAHLYDPDVNPTYCDFANHYNFAVLPARPYTPRDKAPNVLMDTLEERYQKGVLLITSQVDPQGWLKLFEDSVIAEAIVDPLTQPSQLVTLKGTSYRQKLKPNNKN